MRLQLSLSFAVTLAGCANDVSTTRGPDLGAGSDAGASAGGSAGSAGASAGAGTGGAATLPGSAGGGAGGAGGMLAGGSAGSADAGNGGSAGGGGGGAGSGGSAGSSGSAGSGGSAGNAGSAGSAGGGGDADILSIGKVSTTDSEETDKSNTVEKGNDGQDATRWCAADSGLDHWWAIDLAQSHSLSRIEILWEKAVAYQYLIESSQDGISWSTLVDKTASNDTAQLHTLPLATAPEARHLRITVTGLPEGSWASFFEFTVYGY